MKPFFSIIIPTYNRASFIGSAIESVLEQAYENWELIIVDDGSTDNTKEVISQYLDSRIQYHYQENQERSAARNKGIHLASGEWICFLDSDDQYLPDHLKNFAAYIEQEHPDPSLLLAGHLIKSATELTKHPLIDTSQNIVKEIWNKFILMNSVCVHHTILEKHQFNEQYRIWEDTHLWSRIAPRFPLFQLKTYSCIQMIHNDGSVVQNLDNISMTNVDQYVRAVYSLREDEEVMKLIHIRFIKSYVDSKYRMYLYQARISGQTQTALEIWYKAFAHQPSLYLLSELPKILINGLDLKKND